MSSLSRTTPWVSRRYAATREAASGSDSTRPPSRSVRRCFSPAIDEVLAQVEQSSDVRRGVGRRQPHRVRAQLDRQAGRASRCRHAPRLRRRARPARSSSAGVARARWSARRCSLVTTSASAPMQVSPLVSRRLSLRGCCQQRVRGPDPLPVDHHDALLPRPFEGLRAGELSQLGDPEIRVEGKGQQHPAYGGFQVRRPAGPTGPPRGRGPGRPLRASRGPGPRGLVRPPERTAGCRGSCRRPAGAGGGAVEARVERRGCVGSRRGWSAPRITRRRRPSGNASSSAERRPGRRASKNVTVRAQAAYDVRQRFVRRPVQPLDVVDRHEQRTAGRERAQCGEQAERDRLRLRGTPDRVLAVQRHLERMQLR